MKISDLTKPKNHESLITKPMLFAKMNTAKLKTGGDARITYNIMTGNFFVTGQKNISGGYFMPTIKAAIMIAKTINHFNETGEKKAFRSGTINDLELI